MWLQKCSSVTGLCNSKNWHSNVEAVVLSTEESKGAVHGFLYGLKSHPDPAELHHFGMRIHLDCLGLESLYSADYLSFETSHGAIKWGLKHFGVCGGFLSWWNGTTIACITIHLSCFFINKSPVRVLKSAECDIWPHSCCWFWCWWWGWGGGGSCSLPVLRLVKLRHVDMIIRCQR